MAYPYQTGYNQVMPPVYGGYGQQPLQPQGPMCRMVSSREEASSTPVDFSGSLMVFADIQNNRIYTKRWDAAAQAASRATAAADGMRDRGGSCRP